MFPNLFSIFFWYSNTSMFYSEMLIELVRTVFCGKFKTRGSYIADRVEVGWNKRVGSDQNKASYIEFSTMKQVRIDIFLNDESPIRILHLFFLNIPLYLIYFLTNLYAWTPIRIFSRLNNPQQLLLLILILILKLNNILILIFKSLLDMKSQRHVIKEIEVMFWAKFF